jgi:hypothetical protein
MLIKNILLGSCFLLGLTSSGQNITFEIANARITNDGSNSFYEADVVVSTDTDYKLGDNGVFLDYNTAAFGSSIVSIPGAVDVPHPESPFNAASEYLNDHYLFGGGLAGYTKVVNNSTSSLFFIGFAQAIPNTDYPTVTASGSPHRLFSFKIQYVDVNEPANITFNALTLSGNNFTADEGSGPTEITGVSADDSGAAPSFVWTGASSGDWNTAGNWSSNLVPTDKVLIPSGLTNYPTATSAVTVNEMTLEDGTSFIAQSTFSGTVIYKRNLSTSNWYIVSSPVSGQDTDDFVSANNLEASVANPGNIALGSYNTGTNDWSYYNGDTGSATLGSGTGYSVNLDAASGDITFTGSMITDDLTPINLDITGSGFNLVGNPYPSYLNSASLLTTSTGSLDSQTLWIWDQSANAGSGAYMTKVTVDDFKIAPGQGFFVQSNGVAGTLAINEAFQSHEATDTFLRSTTVDREEIHLKITDGTSEMETKIYYIDGATTGFDNGYDGAVFSGASSGGFNIYSHLVTDSEGEDYAIQSLPVNNHENMVIPIGVTANSGSTIEISAESFDLPIGIDVYLEDIEYNTFTLLNETSMFTTTLSEDLNGIGRFFLHASSESLSSGGVPTLQGVSAYPVNNRQLRIVGLNDVEARVRLYNILGKQVLNKQFTAVGSNDIDLPVLSAGVYIVDIKTKEGILNKKVLIE